MPPPPGFKDEKLNLKEVKFEENKEENKLKEDKDENKLKEIKEEIKIKDEKDEKKAKEDNEVIEIYDVINKNGNYNNNYLNKTDLKGSITIEVKNNEEIKAENY